MEPLASGLSALTAMITPAVLISACGTLILSTSTRLSRVVDRVRALSEQFETMAREATDMDLLEERRAMLLGQLDRLTDRARLLQRSMTVFYLALGVFVSTSVTIGMIAFLSLRYAWIPVVLGLFGAGFLFYGSLLLIFEQSHALRGLYAEMDFLWELSKHYAPAELLKRYQAEHPPHRRLTLRRGHERARRAKVREETEKVETVKAADPD